MDKMLRRSHAWVETAPPQLITVRRRALRELPLDTILEEGISVAGHFLCEASAADQNLRPTQRSSWVDLAGSTSSSSLHQLLPAIAFAQ
uniref:Uncharacterized protein n=1 Tax=Physcomitrium patens TaxID=3218 RepID=A0A2K1J089_PHYPA|nr:hypothetical protein PHYPA_022844 [Physcomitrium patens]